MATDQIIKYSPEMEKVRVDLIRFLKDRGIMQSWVGKQTQLSNCSISLFIHSKRELVPEKIEIIKKIIY